MALRDQPYFPLFIQDYLTDEKLNECSAATQGIYIRIMCLMHKSSEYGKLLLKQKHKQEASMSLSFAQQLAKHLTFSKDELVDAMDELISEKVVFVDGDFLCQKRMIKDNELSIKRSLSGHKGGSRTQELAKSKQERPTVTPRLKVTPDEQLMVSKSKVTALQVLTCKFFGLDKMTNARGYMDMCNFIKDQGKSEEKFKYLTQQIHWYSQLVKGGRKICSPRSWIQDRWNAQDYHQLWKQENSKQFGKSEPTPKRIKA